MKKEKISGFELMRIVSMIFIIIYHILLHAGFKHLDNGNYEFTILINSLIIVHVNSFILLTGYFQHNKQVKLSKVISLNNADWFYRAMFLIVFILLSTYTTIKLHGSLDIIDTIKTLSPLDYGNYWFIINYIILYLISPILNKVINNSEKNTLRNYILIIFILNCVIGTFGTDLIIYSGAGRDIRTFILLYFIGAYLSKYPIEKDKLKNTNSTQRKFLFLSMYLFFALIVFAFAIFAIRINDYSIYWKEIGKVFYYNYVSFASPLVIIESIFYFLFFANVNIKSKIINKISSLTLGIYLIHENHFVYSNLYRILNLKNMYFNPIKLAIILLVLAITIFIVSAIIELIRQIIFKFIYNLKLSKKFRNYYRDVIKNLGFNINW